MENVNLTEEQKRDVAQKCLEIFFRHKEEITELWGESQGCLGASPDGRLVVYTWDEEENPVPHYFE